MATNSWQPFARRIIARCTLLEKARWAISTSVWRVVGISRLKDGKLMGIAPLNGTQIQVVQQDLWIAGGTGGVTRVGAASLRSWEGKQQDPIDYTNSDAPMAFCRMNAPADIRT